VRRDRCRPHVASAHDAPTQRHARRHQESTLATADKLRANIDAAERERLVFNLIFVKFNCDTVSSKRAGPTRRFADSADEHFIANSTPGLLIGEVEDRDDHRELKVSWVPRQMLKRMLRKFKYPTDQYPTNKQDAAVELASQQAKALGEARA
jgi:hypothetical protein